MFKFRLQAVLEYRTILEERMLLRFSEATRRLDEEKNRLGLLIKERFNLVAALKNLQENATPVEKIVMLVRYIEALQEKENLQRDIILEIAAEVEEKRKDLLESVQKRKMIEKLKDKNLEDYQRSLADYDRKVMDEMGITRFGGVKS
ncbi:flagellar FliJ protein [Syntrophus gentianae]|uniref:Flagellar FliJ protein n=1 Tax=Syntrophus gentianae TaxID=43775 RepID=A0A1H7VEA5_9BACT|nr:flagellar export protein FliJ [Syntrophus gentianae]SEM07107.1 flagellar FliJ protein [Syntrophus gentianae]